MISRLLFKASSLFVNFCQTLVGLMGKVSRDHVNLSVIYHFVVGVILLERVFLVLPDRYYFVFSMHLRTQLWSHSLYLHVTSRTLLWRHQFDMWKWVEIRPAVNIQGIHLQWAQLALIFLFILVHKLCVKLFKVPHNLMIKGLYQAEFGELTFLDLFVE